METNFTDPVFKGWRKPGPVPPGASGDGPAPADDESLDAISGFFRLFQLKRGHRFSTDDVLTAWYGTTWAPCPRTVLDLGSGIGAVGLIAAWRLPAARFVTVEAQEESVQLAKKSAAWNGVGARYEIRQGDFRDPGVIHKDERFDLILGSPPYFPLGTGVEGDHPQKIACRFEVRGSIIDYCAAASRHLAAAGWFVCVFPVNPEEQLTRVKQAAAASGLALIRWRPVCLRDGERPLLGLFAFMRSNDLPAIAAWEEVPLTIRTRDGAVHPEYAAIKMSFGFPP